MSFVFAGSLPLLPFILFNVGDATFAYSITATASALFIVGAARYFITGVNWIISGLEMLLVGGIAVGASYIVGYLIGAIIAN